MRIYKNNFSLCEVSIKPQVEMSLREDLGFFDITTQYLFSNCEVGDIECSLNTREDGIICGIDVFKLVFKLIDKDIRIECIREDGDKIKRKETIAKVYGNPKSILMAERTALNYIQRMSGIATYTNRFVEILKPYGVKIVDTRKTTPNFRIFEKYAIKTGQGYLHRFNTNDCIMLKDNHIKILGGSISCAVEKIRKNLSHVHKIEVECETIEEVKESLAAKVDIIMLDNMSLEEIVKSVGIIEKRAIVEVSGRITLDNIEQIGRSGVDIISTSALCTRSHALDLGLDF